MEHLKILLKLVSFRIGNRFRFIKFNKKDLIGILLVFLALFYILFASPLLSGAYSLVMGNCTSSAGGGIYGRDFWEMRPAMQGVLVHNYIFDMWADMGYLALGAGIDKNIKARVRPDFYFDGIIRDIKPLAPGKTKADVIRQYRNQFKKYVETVYELNGHAYYPDMEVIFYQLDHKNRAIRIIEEPYKVDLKDLGIESKGETRSSLLRDLSQFLGTVGNLRAVVYDKQKKHMVFFGEKTENPSKLQPDDCLVAAYSVLNTEYQGAMVTIDPDPDNLETRGIVRFGGDIEGTHIGEILFESDRMLKCLGQGYENLEDKPLASNVAGFKPMQDLISDEEITKQKQEWIRFWFMPIELKVTSSANQEIIIFPKNIMTVKTENMKFDGKKLLSDFTPDPTTPQGRFAAHFNDHLDAFADEFPVFRELQEIAKLIAFFKWIQELKISIDLNYLYDAKIRKLGYYEYTPLIKRTRTLTKERKEKNYIITEKITSTLIGGVDLQNFKFKKVPAGSYENLVKAILQSPDNVPFKYGDVLCMRHFFASTSIPNVELRQLLYEKSLEKMPQEMREKIRLTTDSYGRVILYTDAKNFTYYFEYDNKGRLVSVHGWDQPISYKYSYKGGKISFKYELLPNTNEYVKRFNYSGDNDQSTQVQIYKNKGLEHSFSVRIDGDEVIVERECQ
ncbi:MAG: hypothetical protein ACMUIU_04915 [bacterium]